MHPAYKIASFEAVDLPLIRYVAATGKPMIISTGMADAEEIQEAIDAARAGGCRELAILHCVSGYPAPAEDYNLRTIPDMIAALRPGHRPVRPHAGQHHRHRQRGAGRVDHREAFHARPQRRRAGRQLLAGAAELAALCHDARTAWEALGKVDYGRKSSEQGNVKFRRSLYFVKDLKAGDVITPDAVRSVRPGFGAAPKYLDAIVGGRMKIDRAAMTPVHLDDIEAAR